MARGLVMLAAGGTGGHLFPAFALAEELARREIEVDLVTDERGDRFGTGFPARHLHQIASATLKERSPIAVVRTAGSLGKGVASAYALMGRVRPKAVIGFGGYPTFPPLVAARMRGIPTAVHEQNAVMGRANRMLANRVTVIAASWSGTRLLPPKAAAKVVVTGNPVRNAVVEWSRRNYEPPAPGGPVSLVVFGGSQGAKVFSDLLPPAVATLPEGLRRRLQIVQQCREEDLARVGAAYRASGVKAELAAFFQNLPERLANAHLVIARSGASTVSELAVLGRPAILVPLPHSLDSDQFHNARRLHEAGGGWCIEQRELEESSRLGNELASLLQAPDRLSTAAKAARSLGKPDAVILLANMMEKLAGTA